LKVSIKPGDKAVYVGTVQYHRNEFFEVTKVTIVDDYDHANAEFKKKFGARYPLHKALLTSAK
jgi:molybdopterin synthase catalytic subunit